MKFRARLLAAAAVAATFACERPPAPRPAEPPPATFAGRTSAEWHDAVLREAPMENGAEMRALAEGGAAAVPVLLDMVARTPDTTGTAVATEADRFGPDALDAFRRELRTGPTKRRCAAALCIARYGDDALDAAPDIADAYAAASDACDRESQGMAVAAFRLLGPGTAPHLAQVARRKDMRPDALRLLEEWSWLAVPTLEELARDRDAELAGDAAAALALARTRRFATDEWSHRAKASPHRRKLPRDSPFLDVAEVDEDDARELGLEDLDTARAFDRLMEAVADPDSTRERRRAMGTLARFGAEAAPAIPHAIPMLASPDGLDRGAAAWIAVAVGPRAEPMVPGLIAMFDEDLLATRLLAAWALGQIGPAAMPARERMIALWHDERGGLRAQEDPDGRWYLAAMALANIDPARDVDLLAAALDDPRWIRRRAALYALAVAGGPAFESLARTLDEGSPRARAAAAMALHVAGEENPAAYFVLARAADDPDPAVRTLAAQAKRQTGGLESAF